MANLTPDTSNTTPAPRPSLRPSVGDQLKAAVSGFKGPWAGLAGAVVVAAFAQLQIYQANTATARLSYDTLKAASEANTLAIEGLRQSQLELRTWVTELAAAAARRQTASEKVIGSKQNKPSAKPVPTPPVEPVPPAPPAPPPPVPTRLLPFDSLKASPS